jgi:metallo-beta-lactamase family protein
MVIDIKKQKSVLGNFTGELNGPAIRPITVYMVHRVAQRVRIPVVGMGGIMTPEDALQFLANEITTVEKTGGTLLIPAFSIERSQELLHAIHHLKMDQKVSAVTPVFFDGPMAIKVNAVFEQYPDFLNDEFRPEILAESGLTFPGLQVVHKPEESHQIQEVSGPKVIIAGSGMMTGGRILQHAVTYLPQPSTRLLFVGYQSENTLGRQILEGQKHVTINNQGISIKATISKMSALSSHADQPRLLRWLQKISGIQKVFLTHGEDGPRTALAQKIQQDLKIANIALPQLNQLLTVGERE